MDYYRVDISIDKWDWKPIAYDLTRDEAEALIIQWCLHTKGLYFRKRWTSYSHEPSEGFVRETR